MQEAALKCHVIQAEGYSLRDWTFWYSVWSGVECTYFACPLPVKDSNSRCWVPTRPRTKSWHFAHFSTGHSSFESSTVTHILVKAPFQLRNFSGRLHGYPCFDCQLWIWEKQIGVVALIFIQFVALLLLLWWKKMQLCHQSRGNRAMVQSWKKGVNS
jgi:hypothetical protein